MTDQFKVGDRVKKPQGYAFPGIVRSVFETGAFETRVVVEHEVIDGLLHIFNPNQLMPRATFRPFQSPPAYTADNPAPMQVDQTPPLRIPDIMDAFIASQAAADSGGAGATSSYDSLASDSSSSSGGTD